MSQLISTEWLAEHLNDSDLVIADVRWVHQNSKAAYADFLSGHIPGAVFIDVDTDLSEVGDDSKGRHPLPAPADLVSRLAGKGIGKGVRVVATEEESFKVAARLWWLLKWIGVEDVLVLDGGLTKWKAEEREIEQHQTKREPVEPYDIQLREDMMIDAEEVAKRIADGGLVFDARAPERFRGEVEALDKRAGHIKGAQNIPLATLITGDPAQLMNTQELQKMFQGYGVGDNKPVVAYCGSGVTACQLLWALDYAGIQNLQLYPGSWSEWIELHPKAGVKLT